MAAARSPCRCFKTRVLHFKVKNTPLKDKKWKEKVQKNAHIHYKHHFLRRCQVQVLDTFDTHAANEFYSKIFFNVYSRLLT